VSLHPEPLPGLEPAAASPPPAVDTVTAHHAKADRRPADTMWRSNPREQGLIGVTDAIAYFGRIGWSVSMPLIDSQPYDLVVDDRDRLHRVQVKTTTHRSRYGVFVVSLATRGGNQSFHTSKDFDPSTSDLLYVLTDERQRYLIPTRAITTKTSVSLGERMEPFVV
jgi:hypothetical protein